VSQRIVVDMKDFSAGMNSRDNANLISDNALVDAVNVRLGRGYVSKRNGYSKATNVLTDPVTSSYVWHKFDGTTETLCVSNKTLYRNINGVLTAIPFVGIATLTSNEVRFVAYKDRNLNQTVILADGGSLKVYNGTDVQAVTAYTPTTEEQENPGLNDLANLTGFRAFVLKNDRIFALSHPSIKNRLSFCHFDTAKGYAMFDYFPAAFFFDIAVSDNDEIVDILTFRNAIVIFCKRTMWALYGNGSTLDDYELIKINVPFGCISRNSITVVENDIYYLSIDGVYKLFSTDQSYISARKVSLSIEPFIEGISVENQKKSAGVFFQNMFLLSFPTGDTIVYDLALRNEYQEGAWSRWTNVQANSWITDDNILQFTNNNGCVYKFVDKQNDDDGAAIPYQITTKLYDFGSQTQFKKFKGFWIIAKQYDEQSSTFNVTGTIDYVPISLMDNSTDQSIVWDEGDWDEDVWDFIEVAVTPLRVRQQGRNIQLTITSDQLDEPFTLYGVSFLYKPKRLKVK
jgi:hypothetical protein